MLHVVVMFPQSPPVWNHPSVLSPMFLRVLRHVACGRHVPSVPSCVEPSLSTRPYIPKRFKACRPYVLLDEFQRGSISNMLPRDWTQAVQP